MKGEAALAGMDAFNDGLLRSASPYRPGSQEDRDWQAGWFAACELWLWHLRPWPLRDIHEPVTYH